MNKSLGLDRAAELQRKIAEQAAAKQEMYTSAYAFTGIFILILYIIWAIGLWKIFTKMGEKGWKGLIPIYNLYLLFKHVWSKNIFWIWFVGFILSLFSGTLSLALTKTAAVIFAIVLAVATVALFVIHILLMYKVSKAFNHGIPFFIGLIFFDFIFFLILGFGKSQFKNNTPASNQPTQTPQPPTQTPQQPTSTPQH